MEICPICQCPKSSKSSGSLTQWVSTCTCDIKKLEEFHNQEISIKLCKNCGKRINTGRAGSFTQFIFRFDICGCENPEISRPTVREEASSLNDTNSDIMIPSLEVEIEGIEGFPYERFSPLKKLGEGAIGSVYLALDKNLNTQVTIKLLKKLSDRDLVSFQNEARATSKLSHPNIVKVIDFGISQSATPYMVLEYLSGESLRDVIKRKGKLNQDFARNIILKILEATQYAHDRGIYHRDLKPSNIILRNNDTASILPTVIDFGIARVNDLALESIHMENQSIAGTPLYMSPDQGRGKSFDARSEIYTIGCLFFECLTGYPPFTGENSVATLQMHDSDSTPFLSDYLEEDYDKRLDAIIHKAMEKEPENRFQSAQEFHDALLLLDFQEGSNLAIEVKEQKKTDLKKEDIIIKGSLLVSLLLIPVIIYGVYSNIFQVKHEPTEKLKPLLPKISGSREVVTLQDITLDHPAWMIKQDVIRGHNLQDKDLIGINDFPDYDSLLILPPNKITGVGLELVHNKRRFTFIRIKSEKFNDQGALQLSKFKRVKVLAIDHSKDLSINGIKTILTLPRLRSLELRYMSKLPKGTITEIAKKKPISKLLLSHSTPIEAKELKALQNLPRLRNLGLSNTDIDDSVVPIIAKLNLIHLDISGTKITSRGLLQLARMDTLKNLKLTISKDGIIQSDISEFKKINSYCELDLFDERRHFLKRV